MTPILIAHVYWDEGYQMVNFFLLCQDEECCCFYDLRVSFLYLMIWEVLCESLPSGKIVTSFVMVFGLCVFGFMIYVFEGFIFN